MTPLVRIQGQALSLPEDDVDTDVIFPARFLLITEKRGLGRYAFHDRREDPNFALAGRLEQAAPVLIAGANFGCGSSREQAAWALADIGVRVVVAPSFGEIFRSNCFENGMAPITLAREQVAAAHAAAQAGEAFTVDLAALEISAASLGAIRFEMEAGRREALMNGWDEISRIRNLHAPAITRFEERQRALAPWLWIEDERTEHG